MIIRNIYNGLTKYKNLGDFILLPILKKLYNDILQNNYKLSRINSVKHTNQDISHTINIVGGGSIIHPKQNKFTNFKLDNNSSCLVFGTGFTDINKCKINENNVYNTFQSFEPFKFKDNTIKTNLQRIQYYKNNKRLFGGFRGIFEKNISESNGFNFDFINDSGILSYKLLKDTNIKNIHTYNRKIILINVINIFGIDALKSTNVSYSSYNSHINKILIQLSIYLINQGFFILIIPFHNTSSEL